MYTKCNMNRTLCLCMIVKNESTILTECFDSFVNYIDYWVICDTGSNDGTQDVIQKYFKEHNIPGELYEDTWVDFAHNRTLAFKRAKNKAKYCFVIDADDRIAGKLVIPPGNDYLKFRLKIHLKNLEYYRTQIFRNDLDWKYVGVVHEYPCLVNPTALTNKYKTGSLDECVINAGTFGNRSKHKLSKFDRDIVLLKKGLIDEPKNDRYHFYLAQSYKENGNNKQAIIWYKKRVELGGWDEEVYHSLYSIGVCKERSNCNFEKEVLYDYLKAFNYRKTRLEALYQIVRYYRTNDKFTEAFSYGLMGYELPYPKDLLFVEKDIHQYKFLDEFSVAAYWKGFYNISYNQTLKILTQKKYPSEYESRLQANLKFSKDNMVTAIDNEQTVVVDDK